MHAITVRLPEPIYNALCDFAVVEQRSLAMVTRMALTAYLEPELTSDE